MPFRGLKRHRQPDRSVTAQRPARDGYFRRLCQMDLFGLKPEAACEYRSCSPTSPTRSIRSRTWRQQADVEHHARQQVTAAPRDVAEYRRLLEEFDPKADFYAFGTFRLPSESQRIGFLQRHKMRELLQRNT